MFNIIVIQIRKWFLVLEVSVYCDGFCGVYDFVFVCIYVEVVLFMIKKILDFDLKVGDYKIVNIFFCYIVIKEE